MDSVPSVLTSARENGVFIEGMHIGNIDFSHLVWYWLTNTDLQKDKDPRLELLDRVKKLVVVDGLNPNRNRLEGVFVDAEEKFN
jgi:hypothetical protein